MHASVIEHASGAGHTQMKSVLSNNAVLHIIASRISSLCLVRRLPLRPWYSATPPCPVYVDAMAISHMKLAPQRFAYNNKPEPLPSPGGVKPCMDGELQLVSRHQHCSSAKLSQVLHDNQVVVCLDCIAGEGGETLQGTLVCTEVLGHARLAVEVHWALWHLVAYVLHPHVVNIHVSVLASVETEALAGWLVELAD